MWFDNRSSKSGPEREAHEKVQQMMAGGQINSAQAVAEAYDHHLSIARARHAREQEASRLAERQTRAAEVSNQLGERQVKLNENAIRLAERADHRGKLAIGIGIASLVVAILAIVVTLVQ